MSFKDVPPSHPRYHSLLMRHLITEGGKKSIVAESGLIAHGRGEAFDYLLGEETKPFALKAAEAAAALILESERPVLSVNGNAAALCPDEIAEIERISPVAVEINLFYRTPKRERAILKHLKKHGVRTVLGVKKSDTLRLSSLDHARRIVDRNGIAAADTVIVPLEDGDRAEALVREGKKTVVIDLNPLSRTAVSGTVTIVDNITRALPLLIRKLKETAALSGDERRKILSEYDNTAVLKEAENAVRGIS